MAENPDYRELLQLFNDFELEYLIVGGFAVMTAITGVEFDDAWKNKVSSTFFGVPVHFISQCDLEANRRALGRAGDLEDLKRNPKNRNPKK